MKSTRGYIAISAVLLVSFLTAGRTVHYIQLDNDGMRYGLVADQILLGRGLRKPVMFNALHFATLPDSFGTVPYTTQPPLLPALFALLGGLRPGRIWPGQLLNFFSLITIVLFSFGIARRLAGDIAGAAAGIIVAVSYPLLRVAGYIWTDVLFTTFAMVTVGLLQASRRNRTGWGSLTGSGIASACAFATRWVGVALVPLFFWEATVSWKYRGIRRAARTLLFTIPIPLIVIAALWSRNFILTGTIRGDWLPSTGRTWAEASLGFLRLVANQFGIHGVGLRFVLAAVLLGVPVAGLLVLARKRAGLSQIWRDGLDLIIIAAACYAAVLTSALSGRQAVFEPRFAAPLAPLLVITVVVVIVRGWRAIGERRLRALSRFCLVASLILIGIFEAARSYRLLPREARTYSHEVESDWCRWIVSNCEPGTVLVTNAPCWLAFFSGVPTLRPPFRGFNPFKQIPPDMDEILPRKMKEIGARYFLLFEVGKGLPEAHWGEFIAALSRREAVSDKFTLIQEKPWGLVYERHD